MNGAPRHTHHNYRRQPRPSQRRRIRRRHQISAILTVIAVTLLVLFTVFLIIGARMHKKSADFRSQQTTPTEELVTPSTPQTPQILAYPLDRSAPSSSLSALAKAERSAASLSLDEGYSKSTLQSLASSAEKNGIYLSGVFTLTAISNTDDLARYEQLSEDCLLLTEALRAGLDEILLVVPELSPDHVEELKAFLGDLRRLVPEATVGLSLPRELLSDSSAALLDDLSRHFSLLAVDLSEVEDPDAEVEATLYTLLRYSMRVLLAPAESEEAQEELITMLHSHSIKNIQFLP